MDSTVVRLSLFFFPFFFFLDLNTTIYDNTLELDIFKEH